MPEEVRQESRDWLMNISCEQGDHPCTRGFPRVQVHVDWELHRACSPAEGCWLIGWRHLLRVHHPKAEGASYQTRKFTWYASPKDGGEGPNEAGGDCPTKSQWPEQVLCMQIWIFGWWTLSDSHLLRLDFPPPLPPACWCLSILHKTVGRATMCCVQPSNSAPQHYKILWNLPRENPQ